MQILCLRATDVYFKELVDGLDQSIRQRSALVQVLLRG